MITYTYDDMRHEIMSHLKVNPAGYGTWKVSTYVLDGAGDKIYDWFITHDEEDYRGTEGEDPKEWRERMADRFLDDEWYHNGCPDGIEFKGDWDNIFSGEFIVGTEEDLEESHTRRGRMLREGRRPMRRRMNEATAVVNPRIASKFMGKIEDLSRELAKYIGGDEWNSNVISRAVKSLNAAIDHLEDVE